MLKDQVNIKLTEFADISKCNSDQSDVKIYNIQIIHFMITEVT